MRTKVGGGGAVWKGGLPPEIRVQGGGDGDSLKSCFLSSTQSSTHTHTRTHTHTHTLEDLQLRVIFHSNQGSPGPAATLNIPSQGGDGGTETQPWIHTHTKESNTEAGMHIDPHKNRHAHTHTRVLRPPPHTHTHRDTQRHRVMWASLERRQRERGRGPALPSATMARFLCQHPRVVGGGLERSSHPVTPPLSPPPTEVIIAG